MNPINDLVKIYTKEPFKKKIFIVGENCRAQKYLMIFNAVVCGNE
jgi:hypothetical protein